MKNKTVESVALVGFHRVNIVYIYIYIAAQLSSWYLQVLSQQQLWEDDMAALRDENKLGVVRRTEGLMFERRY